MKWKQREEEGQDFSSVNVKVNLQLIYNTSLLNPELYINYWSREWGLKHVFHSLKRKILQVFTLIFNFEPSTLIPSPNMSE